MSLAFGLSFVCDTQKWCDIDMYMLLSYMALLQYDCNFNQSR